MPTAYLAGAELAAYGVPTATAAQIGAASFLIDAYLKRPEGLQWIPDAAGLPCYMAGLTPRFTLKSQGSIAQGQNIAVAIAAFGGTLTTAGSVGDVVILDRANSAAVEACVIASVSPSGIVLKNVVNAHSANATLDFGMVIQEQRTLPAKRSVTRVAAWPVVRMISVLGSYRYGRRSAQNAGAYADVNLLMMMQTLDGPPQWTPADVTDSDFDPMSGEVWMPANVYNASYSDVRLYYVAGFSQANIPPVIKQATANAITANLATQDMAGGIKMAKANDTALERFANTAVDADLRAQIDLYRARMFV